MNDCIRDILRKDMNLYRKYDKAEAKYILSLDDKYELVDIEFEIDKEFEEFIKQLALNNICFDEWARDALIDFIKKQGGKNEKACKYTKNMED